MKREALKHPKMLDLASRLGVCRAKAIGTLTLLWDWTADFAPQGDVGKWPDGAITRACEWDGNDPGSFISALVDSGWLDRHPVHRLLVHDWPDHCERFVKSKLASMGLSFCDVYFGSPPLDRDSRESGRSLVTSANSKNSRDGEDVSPAALTDTSRHASRDPPRDQTKPNQTFRTGRDRSEPACCIDGCIARSIPELRDSMTTIVEPKPNTKLTHGAFKPLREHHLGDIGAIVEWHAKQLSLPDPVSGNTRADLLFVIAAALWAIRLDDCDVRKTRVAAFVNAVKRSLVRQVSHLIPEAERKLREYERGSTEREAHSKKNGQSATASA